MPDMCFCNIFGGNVINWSIKLDPLSRWDHQEQWQWTFVWGISRSRKIYLMMTRKSRKGKKQTKQTYLCTIGGLGGRGLCSVLVQWRMKNSTTSESSYHYYDYSRLMLMVSNYFQRNWKRNCSMNFQQVSEEIRRRGLKFVIRSKQNSKYFLKLNKTSIRS